jgi:hydroxymethylpyrimidine pyrophosphatase-like HAD family hydrolase
MYRLIAMDLDGTLLTPQRAISVAMGNAHDEVKDNADMVTLSNEEDGIAVIIERILEDHYNP